MSYGFHIGPDSTPLQVLYDLKNTALVADSWGHQLDVRTLTIEADDEGSKHFWVSVQRRYEP